MALRSKKSLPPGWILDKDGKASTSPQDYYEGGALLPLGADQGHKGYGLSFMVEVLCGLLTGLGFGVAAVGRHNDGVFLCVIDPGRFLNPNNLKTAVSEFIDYLAETPPAAGFDRVLYPGEVEATTKRERLQSGIPIDDVTWAELQSMVPKTSTEPASA
jgi:uncharacterized oxidoreductase